jgi:hypothetical protein
MVRNSVYSCIVAALALCICACTGFTPLAGGGTDIDNAKISGRILTEQGIPASNIQVTLLPALFDPIKDSATAGRFRDTSDELGYFNFTNVPSGPYNIESLHLVQKIRGLVFGITANRDSQVVASDTLRRFGAIAIQLAEDSDPATCYVYLPGTSFHGSTQNGFALIDSVPEGFIPAVYYGEKTDQATSRVIKTNIVVKNGDTLDIADYSTWKYSKKVYFNTTASGAQVVETVTDVPVLIRLNAANFPFSQAQAFGSDLRFKTRDDAPLPYEIERWDPAAGGSGQAEIWIKIDSVYGNDSTQYITMYWGNAKASSLSAGTRVFDTADGYTAVWHMAQQGNSSARDATLNNLTGTPSGMSGNSRVAGAIGSAQRFNGTSSFFTVSGGNSGKLNFPADSRYTLSAWVKTDTLRGPPYDYNKTTQTILSKGVLHYNLDLNYLNRWHLSVFVDRVGLEQVETPLAPDPNIWQHIVGIRNSDEMYLFIDGEQVQASKFCDSSAINRDTTFSFQIGKIANLDARYFQGIIDEVRVTHLVHRPAWIKLCYMNQRPDDQLVKMK